VRNVCVNFLYLVLVLFVFVFVFVFILFFSFLSYLHYNANYNNCSSNCTVGLVILFPRFLIKNDSYFLVMRILLMGSWSIKEYTSTSSKQVMKTKIYIDLSII
jgi:hypothetical protein